MGYSLLFLYGAYMMSRIPVLLDEETAAGLVVLARQEYRDPRAQAALIIRRELERRGLLRSRKGSASGARREPHPGQRQNRGGDEDAAS